MTALTWSRAWGLAAQDFWRGQQPADHFSTSAGAEMADRVARVIRDTDDRLGRPGEMTIIDIGCGDGALLDLVRERCDQLGQRARWIGVDIRPMRRDGIQSIIGECPGELPGTPTVGVVMAHEWLDEIPCDVVERDIHGVDRVVLVDKGGEESWGPAIADDGACAEVGVDAAVTRTWIERWWPLREAGDRAEVGTGRDRAWAWMGSLLWAGTSLATDYGHDRGARLTRHRRGTLSAYRHGRLVRPVPDGSVGVTAHVSVDSCAAVLPGTLVTMQREEIPTPGLPVEPNAAEVAGYFHALRLRDPSRLGGMGWLRWER